VADRLVKEMKHINEIQVNDVAVGAAIFGCLGLCFGDRVLEVMGRLRSRRCFRVSIFIVCSFLTSGFAGGDDANSM
jgi:hypothetical protein